MRLHASSLLAARQSLRSVSCSCKLLLRAARRRAATSNGCTSAQICNALSSIRSYRAITAGALCSAALPTGCLMLAHVRSGTAGLQRSWPGTQGVRGAMSCRPHSRIGSRPAGTHASSWAWHCWKRGGNAACTCGTASRLGAHGRQCKAGTRIVFSTCVADCTAGQTCGRHGCSGCTWWSMDGSAAPWLKLASNSDKAGFVGERSLLGACMHASWRRQGGRVHGVAKCTSACL